MPWFRLATSMLAGDEATALTLLADVLGEPRGVRKAYESLIAPAQVAIGELWERGQITVAEEHIASEIVLHLLNHIRSTAPRDPEVGKTAVVACVEDERHAIGARIVADLLYLDGWVVRYVGASVPADELAGLVSKSVVDLAAASVTMRGNVKNAEAMVSALHAAQPNLPVMVGGPALGSEEAAASIGADI